MNKPELNSPIVLRQRGLPNLYMVILLSFSLYVYMWLYLWVISCWTILERDIMAFELWCVLIFLTLLCVFKWNWLATLIGAQKIQSFSSLYVSLFSFFFLWGAISLFLVLISWKRLFNMVKRQIDMGGSIWPGMAKGRAGGVSE